jgi:hypothetical protein
MLYRSIKKTGQNRTDIYKMREIIAPNRTGRLFLKIRI